MTFLSSAITAMAAVLSLFPAPGIAAPKPATELEAVLPGLAIANAAPDTPSLLADTAYQQAWLASLNASVPAYSSSGHSSRAVGSWNGRNAYVAFAWNVAEECWVITLVMVSSLPGGVADPFSQSRELAKALAVNARKVMGQAAGGVWSHEARGFFSSVAAGTGFTIVAKNYLRGSWKEDARDKVIASAVALSQAYGFGNNVAPFEPTNSKRDIIPGGIAENLTIIADFKPTPELKELLAKNFHAEELGIKTDTPLVSPPHVSKRDEWCPDYSLHDRVIHGWAPWNTNYDVRCNI